MSQIFRIGCMLLLIGAVAPAFGQGKYRWKDAEGNIHYGDTVPPEYIDQARQRLNDQGVVVEDVPRALTEAELQAEMNAAREQAEAQAAQEAQRLKDQQLLQTYASETDITGTRDERIEVLERAITASRAYANGRTRGLSNLMQRAAQLESRGHSVSDALRSSIEEIRRQINEQETFIQQKEQERERLTAYYNSELERYRELIARRDAARRKAAGS